MNYKFKTYSLADLASNASRSFDFTNRKQVVFINTGDVFEGKFLHSDYSLVNSLPGQAKKKIIKDDILYSEIRPGNKRYAYVNFEVDDYVVSTKFMVVCANERVLPKFLYYILIERAMESEFKLIADSRSGTFPQITFDSVAHLSVRIPESKDVQKKIVSHIEAIDKKIELNQKMNQTLEEMARAIFKEWFVDFRFPGHEKVKFIDGLPEGWRKSIIGKEVEVVGGSTPSTKNKYFWEGGIHCWATPRDLSSLSDKILLKTERFITYKGLAEISSGLLPEQTVIMSSRAPVGYLAITQVEAAINQGFIAMKCLKSVTPEFVLQWVNFMMPEIKMRSSGTTFAEISKKNFKTIPVNVPSNDLLNLFSILINEKYGLITSNVLQNNSLTEIRNELLPRLMSGELI